MKYSEAQPPIPSSPVLIDPHAEEQIRAAYDYHCVDSSLRNFMQGAGEEPEVESVLSAFSSVLAKHAIDKGYIDIDIVRFGVEHLTDSMNKICRETFTQRERPTGLRSLLAKAGITRPPHLPETYIRKLDDRYWSKQFLEQYEDNLLVNRQPEESDQEYLGRYIDRVIHGFVFAPFTFIRP